MTATYAPQDLYNALRAAEEACREHGASGPILSRYIDGWEASGVIVGDGRRFHRAFRSKVLASPVAALEELCRLLEADAA